MPCNNHSLCDSKASLVAEYYVVDSQNVSPAFIAMNKMRKENEGTAASVQAAN